MTTLSTIFESHLGGFYRYQVTHRGRVVMLTAGVSEHDRKEAEKAYRFWQTRY
jgi:hypothetical protein